MCVELAAFRAVSGGAEFAGRWPPSYWRKDRAPKGQQGETSTLATFPLPKGKKLVLKDGTFLDRPRIPVAGRSPRTVLQAWSALTGKNCSCALVDWDATKKGETDDAVIIFRRWQKDQGD